MKKIFLAGFIVFLALVANKIGLNQNSTATPVSAAAVDYYLKIDGIEGESNTEAHRDEIEILSWSWGETNTAGLLLPAVQKVREAASRNTSTPEISDFKFEMDMNKASPKIMQAALSGKHIPMATLHGVRTDGNGARYEFMKITLEDLLVSSYQTGGSSGAVPMDSFSLNFEKIKFEYNTRNEDGTEGETVEAGWDLSKNASY